MISANFLKAQKNQGLGQGLTSGVFAPIASAASSLTLGESTGEFNWKAAALVILTVALVAFILLVIAHYTIRPIFKTRDAGPGFIPIPTVTKDATGIYWKDLAKPLASIDTVLGENDTGTVNYSMAVDILIQDPSIQSSADRPIFWRSTKEAPDTPRNANGPSIVDIVGDFNFAVYLANSTNDLVVSVLNAKRHIESVAVSNIPVGVPFRLGIILSERFLEVYLNGKLYKTRNLETSPVAVAGSFMPASGPYKDMAILRNLRLWKGTISPAEMRYLPALPSKDSMKGKERNTDISLDLAGQLCNQVNTTDLSLGTLADNISMSSLSESISTLSGSLPTLPASLPTLPASLPTLPGDIIAPTFGGSASASNRTA